jgi:aspartate racemase
MKMLNIGLLGGMTAESSREYYQIINEKTRERLGGIHSARSIMVSLDFAEIEHLMDNGRWSDILTRLIEGAQQIERGGGDLLVLCTNTMHKLADQIQAQISIPIINIIDVTAAEVIRIGCQKVGLLGTRFTMEEDFYRSRLEKKHGLEVIIPDADQRELIHRVIVDELSVGRIDDQSKMNYYEIIDHMVKRGAQGVILGCTEIPLLVSNEECVIPLFDTTHLHASAAVDFALDGNK